MSALCQKETFCGAAQMSLFDQLVGGGEQRLRDGQAKRFGGFEIDDERELSLQRASIQFICRCASRTIWPYFS
jgi:hypothetical protein